MRGSFTVEATFIICISAWVLVALCYGGMYIHDQVVVESETNIVASRGIREEQKDLPKEIRDTLDKKLFFFQVKKVEESNLLNEKTIEVSYQIPVSFPLLKRLWMGKKKALTYKTVREKLTPALWKWDLEKEEENGEESDSGEK